MKRFLILLVCALVAPAASDAAWRITATSDGAVIVAEEVRPTKDDPSNSEPEAGMLVPVPASPNQQFIPIP